MAMSERLGLDHFRKLLPAAGERLNEIVRETCSNIFTPVPYIKADKWAEETIDLPPEVSSDTGLVRLMPYQRDIVNAPFEDGVLVVTVMKSARVGFSLIAAIQLLYVAARLKLDAFLAQPIAKDAQEFHDDFLSPIIMNSPQLAALKRIPTRGGIMDRWSKFRLITGAAIRLVGAQKADVFRRFKAFIGILDEVDAKAYGSTREDDQGNKIELAERRLDTYPGSALVIGGTPTDMRTSRLLKYWNISEQRRRFWPCLKCGEMQHLIWGDKASATGFKWKLDPVTGEVLDVYYKCRKCGARMEEDDKGKMDEAGEWRVTQPAKSKGYVAFHIWEAYASNPKSTWTKLVGRFLDGVRSGDLQPFINLSLGEPFEHRSSSVLEASHLAAHCRAYEAELPDECVDWTMGVDTQKGSNKENSDGSLIAPQRHEADCWGWGVGNKPIFLGRYVKPFEGEPFVGESALALDSLLLGKTFRRRNGDQVPYATAFLDGGHAQDAVIAYVRQRVELGWNDIHVVRGSKRNDPTGEVIMSRRGKSNRTGEEFIWLNTRPAKDHLDRLLRNETPGPRYVTFPLAMRKDTEFFNGILNEELRPEPGKKGGALRWQKKGGATGEAWDNLVYAYAAQIKAQSVYPGIDRLISGASPFSLTKTGGDGVVQIYDGPDLSAMADKSEERGLVPAVKAKPQRTTNRAQPQGQATAAIQHQNSGPEVGSLQRRAPAMSKRSSMF